MVGPVAPMAKPREKATMQARFSPSAPRSACGWLVLALGCAGCVGGRAAPTSPDAVSTAQGAEGVKRGTAISPSAEPTGQAGVAPPLPSPPLPGGEEPTPHRALPELRVEALGMHVGGGSNSPEEKAPFHRALERQFPRFLACYRGVEQPWAGGSFGIDLKVPRSGGRATVEQPRTKMRGEAFRDCMLAALGAAEFERPKAGPTVLSYSVRFTLRREETPPAPR